MAKILRNSAREVKKNKKGDSDQVRHASKTSLRRFLINLWILGAIIWVGLLLWAYNWSSKKSELRQKVVEEYSSKDTSQGSSGVKESKNSSPLENRHSLPSTTSSSSLMESQNTTPSSSYDANKPEKDDGNNLGLNGKNSPKNISTTHSAVFSTQRKISIIIDDMGGSIDIARKFIALPYPIAFAVLPYEPYSREVARLAKEHGKVVLLHMPMEPHGYPEKNPGKGALLMGQDKETQRRLFFKALEQVPGAVGVNNHMGSRFTENREAMSVFLELVKEKKLFFIDSATTDKTVACDVAREVGVPCLRRDVFLDHEVTVSFTRAQLVRLFDVAKTKELTIAIGHPHRVTLELLQKGLTETRSKNLEIVSLDVRR